MPAPSNRIITHTVAHALNSINTAVTIAAVNDATVTDTTVIDTTVNHATISNPTNNTNHDNAINLISIGYTIFYT